MVDSVLSAWYLNCSMWNCKHRDYRNAVLSSKEYCSIDDRQRSYIPFILDSLAHRSPSIRFECTFFFSFFLILFFRCFVLILGFAHRIIFIPCIVLLHADIEWTKCHARSNEREQMRRKMWRRTKNKKKKRTKNAQTKHRTKQRAQNMKSNAHRSMRKVFLLALTRSLAHSYSLAVIESSSCFACIRAVIWNSSPEFWIWAHTIATTHRHSHSRHNSHFYFAAFSL